jgi:hypothetical protein
MSSEWSLPFRFSNTTIRAACPVNIILLDLITLPISGYETPHYVVEEPVSCIKIHHVVEDDLVSLQKSKCMKMQAI